MNVTDRFLKYVSFDTQSDEESVTAPSTEKQKLLGAHIADDLRAIGLSDVVFSEYGYVYATLPANVDRDLPVLGLIAHMDTSPDAPGADIRARIVEYTGGDILLNETTGDVLSPKQYESLNRNVGKHLIVTDGTTLLGADDKAGAAEIITAVEELIASGKPHGTVRLAITPDEEVGRGTENFDLEHFGADYAYTVDGGTLGELEYENFNAASAKVTLHGVNIHPGSAKDKMKNACLLAMEFNSLLPPLETPAHTTGYQGFFHLGDMKGDTETAVLRYIIRDHDKALFEQRKQRFAAIAGEMNLRYGAGTAETEIADTYYNMRVLIEPHMVIVDRAKAAFLKNGVQPLVQPIRGGTDGAQLTYRGLPCPNLSTGGENFHGRFEYVPVEDMESMVAVIKTLVTDLAE